MASKYTIYAVAYGIDPSTQEPVRDMKFGTWKQCQPYIVGIEGANFKGFFTDTEADAWLAIQDGQPRGRKPRLPKCAPQPAEAKRTKDSAVLSCSKEEIKSRFAEKCVKLNMEPNMVMFYLMEQWINMTDFIHVAEDAPPDDDDDDSLPWF